MKRPRTRRPSRTASAPSPARSPRAHATTWRGPASRSGSRRLLLPELLAHEDEVREERLELDPLVAPLDEPELRLPDPVDQSDLERVRDAEVEDGPMDRADYVLPGETVLDQQRVKCIARLQEVPAKGDLEEVLDELRPCRARRLVQGILVDRRAHGGRDLEGVHRLAEVPLRDVHEGVHPLLRHLQLLRLRDP